MGARYTDPSAVEYPELLADSVANQGLFVGPVLANPWARALEAFPVTIGMGGAVLAQRDGKHPDGHPLQPLYWLANWSAQQGDAAARRPDRHDGFLCGVVEVPIGTPLTVTYGDLGSSRYAVARGMTGARARTGAAGESRRNGRRRDLARPASGRA